MSVGGARLNSSYDIHAAHHLPERGEPLAVRISFSSEVELGLVADTYEEIGPATIRPPTSHRNSPVTVRQPCDVGTFERNRRERGEPSAALHTALNHLDAHIVVWLIVRSDGAANRAGV